MVKIIRIKNKKEVLNVLIGTYLLMFMGFYGCVWIVSVIDHFEDVVFNFPDVFMFMVSAFLAVTYVEFEVIEK